MENALPGTEKSMTFSISSDTTSTEGVAYEIKWVEVNNQFKTQSDLVYTLSGTGDDSEGTLVSVTNKQAPSSATETIGNGKIMPGETHSYTLTMIFRETGSEQNSNQDVSFSGKINVATDTDLKYNSSYPSGTSSEVTADEHVAQ